MRDFDRPLNDRGERDAPIMAARLKARIGKIDLIAASPARRTTLTSDFASIELDVEQWSWVTRLSGRLLEYDYPKKEM